MPDRLTAVIAMEPEVAPIVLPDTLRDRIRRVAELDDHVVTDFADPAVLARLARADILISGWGCPVVDAGVLAAAPRLRAVVHAAGSVKHHLRPEVWQRGIAVSSAAAVNALPVAQYTTSMVMLAGKRVFRLARGYAQGRYRDNTTAADTGNNGRTVGVIGASRIGRLVLEMLGAQGYRLLVADPTMDRIQAARLRPYGQVRLVTLDDLLRRSDIVSVHAPDLPETRHLLDDARLGLLRDGAILINTARGQLIDTEALTRHCASGRIDAVLDVTDPEPLPPGHPLLSLPNVLVTPHVAGAAGTEVRRLGEFAAEEIERIASGLPLAGEVRAAELALLA